MSKKVVIISSSLRVGSNSEILARSIEKGIIDAGNEVSFIELKNKSINFCRGCLACVNTLKCVIKDDVVKIMEEVKNADVLVFVSPVYYYTISGQLKTLLDRLNPLYNSDYKFRDVYFVSTAAENDEETFDKSITCMQGWVDCFEKASIKGTLCVGGKENPRDAANDKEALENAYKMGLGM